MKRVKGYIFSRPFMGERVPQSVQNIVIRDFCDKNSLQYMLSAVEYAMRNSSLILKAEVNSLISEESSNILGLISYSMFQLPESDKLRKTILKKMIMHKKIFFCALENIKVSSISDINKIENIWRIKKNLPNCINKI